MRISSTIGATLALCTSVLAWDITFYTDKNCGSNNGDYVFYTGTKTGTCLWLGDTSPSWAECTKYTDGGTKGPFDCTADDFKDAYSFIIRSGDFRLAGAGSADSGNCQDGFSSSETGCQVKHVRGFTPN